MIPQTVILEWQRSAPWADNNSIEQDLIISRAIVEIFNDDFLQSNLAFRGGTALHKLFLPMAMRYSEDIDLVQITEGPVGPMFDRLRSALAFLGEPKKTIRKQQGNKMLFAISATMPPIQQLKLKIEMNSTEGASVVFGYAHKPFSVATSWFAGKCNVTTYSIDELLGTKMRALYQRRKGRDLFDLWAALELGLSEPGKVVEAFRAYAATLEKPCPSSDRYLENLALKMADDEFIGDIGALIRPGIEYHPHRAFEIVREELIARI
jgi:predicted nucleotidyltransferase component of viral defense system